MHGSIEAQIQCPFFVSESKLLLCCEGLLDTTCMITSFPEMQAKLQHVNDFCKKKDGGSCPMAVNLYEKYKRLELTESDEERLKRLHILNSLVYV